MILFQFPYQILNTYLVPKNFNFPLILTFRIGSHLPISPPPTPIGSLPQPPWIVLFDRFRSPRPDTQPDPP
ncbi:hypothetical protein HanXRQr2_Chr08g0327671 [Helianthus annuus]|uniref:Uncharacterized protein n=1 Tax=Helianthus annuus TaxID=4232 RepID=A0A251U8T4_HELAN|nr:hypothetical protein HanXRQr2_Chr08g0327671 [Helianthus annuus]KAJ0951267.1 hypothetical protein HanPSC8_Chr02g0057971 [Helianthus annuus]